MLYEVLTLVRYSLISVTILWFYLFHLTQWLNAPSNNNLLPNVNPECFCDDAWETLLLKRKGGWQTFFDFLEKITYWAYLLRSRLKLIFHWKAHCFILARSLLSFDVIITDSWITGKWAVSSAKSLVLNNNHQLNRLYIYIY